MGPIFDIIEGLPKFIKHSIDDLVEDAIKLAMFKSMFLLHSISVSRLIPNNLNIIAHHSTHTLPFLFYYWVANETSDNIADQIDEWKNDYFGLNYTSTNNKTKNQNFVIDLTEDLVEDIVKFSMLYCSYKVGILIADNHIFKIFLSSTNLPYGQNIGKVLDFTVKWVTPITEYTRCNEYSDKAGDVSQYYAEELLNYSFSNSTVTTFDEL